MRDDFDSDLGRLIDAARSATEPTAEDHTRIRARLAAKLASGVVLTSATASAVGGAGSALTSGGLKLVLLTQVGPGLLAGTLLGGGVSLLAATVSDPPTKDTDTAVSAAPAPAGSARAPIQLPVVTGVSSRAALPQAETAPLRERSSARLPAEAVTSERGHTRSTESAIAAFPPPKARTENSELSDELALVSRIQQAWQRGDAAGARRAIETHEQRFPRGTLTEEREAVKVMLACRSGEPTLASKLGSAFLAQYPGSTHAARVSAICKVKR
jgi:hypothetical protein